MAPSAQTLDCIESEISQFSGPVEVDKNYIGGKRKNMSNAKRRQLRKDGTGRGAVSKTAVFGAKDRETLHGFVHEQTNPDAQVHMDDASTYMGMDRAHESFNHSVSKYVRVQAHTNGMGFFWAALKRSYHSNFRHFLEKYMHRYVSEFLVGPMTREKTQSI